MPAAPQASSRRWIAAGLVVAAATLALFWRVGGFAFLDYDDAQYLRDNQAVHGGLTRDGVVWAFTSAEYASNWHPLTWLSHMLDVELFGLSPRGPHLVNAALHAANAALLLLVLGAATGALRRSAFVAALFALHPLHVESAAWVAERKDVLSCLLWLLATGAYLRYARGPTRARYAAVAVLLALGLMAKPMLVTLPLVLLLLDWWPLGRLAGPGAAPAAGRLFAEKLPLAALAVAAATLTLLAQRRGGSVIALEHHPLGLRLANALVSYVVYAVKLLWPAKLSVLYPLGEVPAWKAVAAAAALVGASWAAARAARRSPWLAAGWLWYLATLLPVIGLVQVGAQSRADRYTYIPLTGLFVVVAWGASRLLGEGAAARRAMALGGALTLAALAALTHLQLERWRDDVALFSHALRVAPDNGDARYNLGRSLLARKRPAEAVVHLQRAVELSPGSAPAWNDLGLALKRLRRPREAVAAFERAIAVAPRDVNAYLNLGYHHIAAGDREAALKVHESLQLVDPGAAEAFAKYLPGPGAQPH